MLPLRALLLWSLVSVHVAGGAILFRRLFGREHDWYGFLVPGLALCLGLNFIEYFIAVPTLLWLLPFTTIGSLLLVVRPDLNFRAAWRRIAPGSGRPARASGTAPAPIPFSWEGLRLPLGIFLGSFAFTFLLRCLQPDVLATSDGLADLNLIANFLKGQTLPPTDGWMPPFKLKYYYTFQHYAASVLTRLFGVDMGTGYNLSHALLSAFVCFVAAAAAWRIAGRVWIAVIMPFLVESAATGSSAYLRLTEPGYPSPWTMSNLSGGLDHPDSNPIWKLLASAPFRERLELQPPGYWSWRDEYHPNAGGQFLTLFSVWVLAELFRKERLNWSWIAAFLLPFFALITSTWALPITGLLCGGGLVLAYARRHRAENAAFVFGAVALGVICMWPSLMPLFTSPIPTPVMWNHHEWRTPIYEFLVQWWPVLLPWVCLLAVWPRLATPVKWAVVVVPLMLIGIENLNIEDGRFNTVEKMWGYTYGAGLVAFFPALAMRRAVVFRLVTVLLLASASVALFGWMRGTLHWTDWSDAWHIEGDGILRNDPQRARLLQVLSQFDKKTIITGKVDWAYYDSPALAVFSGNRDYIAWTNSEEHYGHQGENEFRAAQVNDLYAGTSADPLGFLTGNSIQAVVIWPDDHISDAQLAALKSRLAPVYTYVDCRGDGPDNAGVFLRQPAPSETSPGP